MNEGSHSLPSEIVVPVQVTMSQVSAHTLDLHNPNLHTCAQGPLTAPDLLRIHWERVSRTFLKVNLAWGSAPAWDQLWSLARRLHLHLSPVGEKGAASKQKGAVGKAPGSTSQGEALAAESECTLFTRCATKSEPCKKIVLLFSFSACIRHA